MAFEELYDDADFPKGPNDPPSSDDPPKNDDPPKKDEGNDPPKEDDEPPTLDDLLEDDDPAKDDDLPDEVPEGDKAGEAWKRMKQELKDLRAERDSLNEEKETLSKRPSDDDVAKLKAERDALDKELYVSRIEAHPKYIEAVTQPQAEVLKTLRTDYKEYEGVEAILFDSKTVAAREKALEAYYDENDVPRVTQRKFDAFAEKLDAAYEKDVEMMADAKATLERLGEADRTEAANQRAVTAQEYSKASGTTFEKLTSKLPFMMGEDGELLPEFKKTQKEASDFEKFSKESLKAQAFKTAAGFILPEVIRRYYAETKEVQKLKDEIAKLQGVKPGAGKGGDTKPTDTPKPKDKKKAFTGSLDDAFDDVEWE